MLTLTPYVLNRYFVPWLRSDISNRDCVQWVKELERANAVHLDSFEEDDLNQYQFFNWQFTSYYKMLEIGGHPYHGPLKDSSALKCISTKENLKPEGCVIL